MHNMPRQVLEMSRRGEKLFPGELMNQLSNYFSRYPVSREQSQNYQREGHILLKNVASRDEVEVYRHLITGVVDEVVKVHDSQGRISDYGKMFT